MGVFLLFYQFLLEKESMHVFKRFFLLSALILSLLIPTIVFTEYVEVEPVAPVMQPEPIAIETATIPNSVAVSDMDIINWNPILWTLYVIGLLFFGFRFVKHLFQINHRIRKNPKLKQNAFIKVLLNEKMPPHTFFKYIFLNKKEVEKNTLPAEVLLHEETHARQLHSIDVVFIELLQVALWFNPLVYLFKKNIKLNHEFLADSAVLKKNIPSTTYQNTLLSFLSAASEQKYQSVKMVNTIIYSSTRAERSRSIKKRFIIMKTETSKKSKNFKSLLIFPLVVFLLFGFSETKVIEKQNPGSFSEISPKKDQREATSLEVAEYNALAKKFYELPVGVTNPSVHQSAHKDYILSTGEKVSMSAYERVDYLYNLMSDEQKKNAEPYPFLKLEKYQQETATREQIKEYNALAKKYNNMLSKKHFTIQMRDVEKLKYIYSVMSEKQKADAQPFPNFPVPPEPPTFRSPPEVREVPPPPPPETPEADEIKEVPEPSQEIVEAPTPPTPPNPLDHVVEMAKKGATFYYRRKKITSDEAIQLLKANKDLSISTEQKNNEPPIVKISKYL